MPKTLTVTWDEKNAICNLYTRGCGIHDLARSFHMGERRIRALLVSEGIKLRRAGEKTFDGGMTSCPRRASILHLVDLKRAGHSPRHTELRVEGETFVRPTMARSSFSQVSCFGSPAASCVGG